MGRSALHKWRNLIQICAWPQCALLENCGLITNHSFTTSTPMSHMQWVSATPEANPVCSLPAPKALQATYQMLHRCRTPNATHCTCASRMQNTGEAAKPIATLPAHTLHTAGHAQEQSSAITPSPNQDSQCHSKFTKNLQGQPVP